LTWEKQQMTTYEILLYIALGVGGLVALGLIIFLYLRWTRPSPAAIAATVPDNTQRVTVHVWLYFATLALLYIVVPGLLPLQKALGANVSDTAINLMYIVSALHFAASIRFVSPQYQSAIQILTFPALETRWLLIIRPLGFSTLTLLPRKVIQRDIPGPPEKIHYKDDKDYTPELKAAGVVLPIRVTTGPPSDNAEDKKSPINYQLTLEWILTPRLEFIKLFQFIVKMDGNISELWRILQDTAQDKLTEECAKRSAAGIIRELTLIKKAIRNELQSTVANWGIYIEDLDMKSPDLSHPLSTALRDLAKADTKARQTRLDASARAFEVETVGEAQAKADAAGIRERGRADKEVATMLGVDPVQVLAATVAERTVGRAGTVIAFGANGLTESIAAGAAIVNAMGRGSPSPTPPPTTPPPTPATP
jgi:regulator of protease activity HflC (stomatin/prohibitin superfamily)